MSISNSSLKRAGAKSTIEEECLSEYCYKKYSLRSITIAKVADNLLQQICRFSLSLKIKFCEETIKGVPDTRVHSHSQYLIDLEMCALKKLRLLMTVIIIKL